MPDWIIAALFAELGIEKAGEGDLIRAFIHLIVGVAFLAKFTRRMSEGFDEKTPA